MIRNDTADSKRYDAAQPSPVHRMDSRASVPPPRYLGHAVPMYTLVKVGRVSSPTKRCTMSDDDEVDVLSRYCQNLGKVPQKGDPSKFTSNSKWKCLKCKNEFVCSGVNKPIYHCNKVPGKNVAVCKSNKYSIEDKEALKSLLRSFESVKTAKEAAKSAEEKQSDVVMGHLYLPGAGSAAASRIPPTPGTMPYFANKLQKDDVDLSVAMAFYANGIPFNVSRNRYWKRMMRKVAAFGAGYKPPGYNPLRTTLLDKVSLKSKKNCRVIR